jgi:hypothetical protein
LLKNLMTIFGKSTPKISQMVKTFFLKNSKNYFKKWLFWILWIESPQKKSSRIHGIQKNAYWHSNSLNKYLNKDFLI